MQQKKKKAQTGANGSRSARLNDQVGLHQVGLMMQFRVPFTQ